MPLVKPVPQDAFNASNVGRWKYWTYCVAFLQTASDKWLASNVDVGRCLTIYWSLYSELKNGLTLEPRFGTQIHNSVVHTVIRG